MDPITSLVIIGSLIDVTDLSRKVLDNSAVGNQGIAKDVAEFVDELTVLHAILQECRHSLSLYTTTPASVTAALGVCTRRKEELVKLLKPLGQYTNANGNLWTRTKLQRQIVNNGASAVKSQLRSFRESVLLLRDLISDVGIKERIVELQMSAQHELMEMRSAILPALEKITREVEGSESGSSIGHDVTDGTDIDATFDANSTSSNSPVDDTSSANSPTHGRRPGRLSKYRSFMRLRDFNFVDDIMVILPVAGYSGCDKWEYIPTRVLIDSGSDENFIQRSILTDHNMDLDKIVPVPIKRQIERKVQILDGRSFTPKEEVNLSWHRLQDRNQRKGTFIILDHPGFGVILGAKHYLKEMKKAAPAVSHEDSPFRWMDFFRPQKRAEKEEMKKRREHEEAMANKQAQKQYEELKNRVEKLKRTTV